MLHFETLYKRPKNSCIGMARSDWTPLRRSKKVAERRVDDDDDDDDGDDGGDGDDGDDDDGDDDDGDDGDGDGGGGGGGGGDDAMLLTYAQKLQVKPA